MVTEGIEPSTVALLAQRSNQLSYATSIHLRVFIQFKWKLPKTKLKFKHQLRDLFTSAFTFIDRYFMISDTDVFSKLAV